MKSHLRSILLLPMFASLLARGQGTFIYDQQSSTEAYVAGGYLAIQLEGPIGQSFTPTFSSVGFIRFYFADLQFGDGRGATVYVNLIADSFTNGTVLSSTDPVFMPDSFVGPTNFFFTTPVAVTPGVTYYFQPIVQSGAAWGIQSGGSYFYSGGVEYQGGVAFPVADLWFREGVVPEPASGWLIVLGSGLFVYAHRARITGRLRR